MQHNKLTIVAVYGHNNGASVIPALQKSVEELPGSQGLLLSLARPPMLPDNIEHRSIFSLDYYQYSWFMMYSLHNFIDTDFALVVQDDGWVIDGKNFLPEYYDYDYIGAITHCALTNEQYHYNWSWRNVDEPMYVIQNGGFSLRSKRFLEAPSKFGVMHQTFNVQPFCNEDVQLTSFLRPKLESLGMKYASLDVAKHFAAEYFCPGVHNDLQMDRVFGIHGQSRKLIDKDKVLVLIKDVELEEQYREEEFLSFLESKGYELTYERLPKTSQDGTEEAGQSVLAG